MGDLIQFPDRFDREDYPDREGYLFTGPPGTGHPSGQIPRREKVKGAGGCLTILFVLAVLWIGIFTGLSWIWRFFLG